MRFSHHGMVAIVCVVSSSAAVQQTIAEKLGKTDQPKRLQLDLGNGGIMEFVLVGPGRFVMGSPNTEAGREKDEIQHEVTISKPLFVAVSEVTRRQFNSFVVAQNYKTELEKNTDHPLGRGGQGFDPDLKRNDGWKPKYSWRYTGFDQNDDHPVVNVTWNDAVAFCQWLSKKIGRNVDLPTEAEWEFACRAGTKTCFFTGATEQTLAAYANVADQQLKKVPDFDKLFTDLKFQFASFNDGFVFTAPVKRFRANPWGLYDMHGNVFEWCKDFRDKKYYENSPKENPGGPLAGTVRVIRGGCWSSSTDSSRSAARGECPANLGLFNLGFRIVMRPTANQ